MISKSTILIHKKYLPVKVASKINSGQAAGQTVETFLGEYKEAANGLTLPHTMEVKVGGATVQKLTFSEVVFNEELEDDFFAFPKK